MPAYSAKDSALAVKLVTRVQENKKQGHPSFANSNVMVLDPRNGLPQAVSESLEDFYLYLPSHI